MKNLIDKLKEFNKSFKVKTLQEDDKANRSFTCNLRYKLMEEENFEYLEACAFNNKEAIVDALGDQLYILIGTIVHHGLEDVIEDVFEEIHRSNMSKLNSEGEPIINGINGFDNEKPEGKILKSENYFEPNLKKFV